MTYLMKLNNKKIRPCDLNYVSHRIYICIGMYIIAVTDSVTFHLYLLYDFYYSLMSYLLTYLLTYSMEQSPS
jgi:hypothetical protein